MLCHLADSYEIALGQRAAEPAPVPGARLVKQMALWSPMRWPHALKTLPEVDANRPGAKTGSFAEEHARLLSLIEEFASFSELASRPHPIFGAMSAKDWQRWGYLHCDHHLRQFGA